MSHLLESVARLAFAFVGGCNECPVVLNALEHEILPILQVEVSDFILLVIQFLS